MTGRERIACAMRLGCPDRVPVMCQLALGHYFLNASPSPREIWFTSEGFARALVELQRRYRFDGVLVNLPGRPPDLLRDEVERIEQDGADERIFWKKGVVTVIPPDDNPRLLNADGSEPGRADFDALDPADLGRIDEPPGYTWNIHHVPHLSGQPRPGPFDALPPYFPRTLACVRELAGEDVSVHGEVFSPFTHYMELFGYDTALVGLIADPAKAQAFLARLAEAAIAWGTTQARAGVDAVLVSSAFAGGGFISRAQYREFVLPHERRLIEAIRSAADVPVYTHTCGKIGDRLDLLAETGSMGIDTLDPPPLGDVELADAKRQVGTRLFLKGNLDSVALLHRRTAAEVTADVAERLRDGAPGGGYILSTACSVAPRVEPWKLELLTPLAEKWGRTPHPHRGGAPGAWLACALGCALMMSHPLDAAAPAAATQEQVVFSGADLAAMQIWNPNGQPSPGRIETATAPDEGAPVARVTVSADATDPESVQLRGTVGTELARGSVCQLRARLRATRPARGEAGGRARIAFQRTGARGRPEAMFPLELGTDWEPVQVAFPLAQHYEADAAELRIALGWPGQQVEIADLEIRRCAPGTDPSDIPVLGVFYPGMEPDAPWRAEAARRIDVHRRAPLAVTVLDANGHSVDGAAVTLKLERVAFQFGCRIAARIAADESSERAILYRANVGRLCNAVLLQDEFSWPLWRGESTGIDPARLHAALRWLEREGIHVLGYGMLDPTWDALPRSVRALRLTPAQIAGSAALHVQDLARRMHGLVDEWALTPGLLGNPGLFHVYGPETVADWIRAARTDAPHVRVALGEDGALDAGGAARRRQLDETMSRLMAAGAALDGLVLEARFDWRLTPPENLWDALDLYARFGKPITIANFEASLGVGGIEARYLEDWLLAAFAHPAVRGFYLAGFWEGDPWHPASPLFALDWSERAPVSGLNRLVAGEWRAATEGRTDKRGLLVTELLCGDYEIRIRHAKGWANRQVVLRPPGREIKVFLETGNDAPAGANNPADMR